jgi:pimeloyl-ACP methyl ester carboxylesterase
MVQVLGYTLSRLAADTLPPGRPVELSGRGTTFVYEQPGPSDDAPTIMLIHGLAASGALNWFPAFGPLSQRHRVVALDLRGHGHGIPSKGHYRLADCADDVVALADELGIDRFIPVGYSLGGPVAQLVWHRHRERVEGMVLCATSRNFGGTTRERWFYGSLWGAIVGLQVLRHVPPFRGRAREEPPFDPSELDGTRMPRWALAELRRCSPSTLLAAMNALGRFSSHRWIEQVDVPTAVVVTTKDKFVAPPRQLKLAQAIPGATVHPAHTDHAACVLGARRFIPALLEACESVTNRIPARNLSLST